MAVGVLEPAGPGPLTTRIAVRAVLGPTGTTRFAVPGSTTATRPARAGVVGRIDKLGRGGDRTLDASVLDGTARDGGGRRDDDNDDDVDEDDSACE